MKAQSDDVDPYDVFHVVHPLFIKGAERERERIIALIRSIAVVNPQLLNIIAIIKGDINTPEIPQFEGTRDALNNLTSKGERS